MSHRTYTISALAREFDLTARALRFYEDKGLVSPSRRGNRGGFGAQRIYTEADRERVALITRCRRAGLSIIAIQGVLAAAKGPQRRETLRALLELSKHEARAQLDAATAMLADLETGAERAP